MTLHDKISALPEWPEDIAGYPPPDDAEWNDYLHAKIGCALARLALLREQVIADCLHSNCPHQHQRTGVECTCSRSALLAATEVPK